VELAVTYTEPATRGDTASGSVTKAAKLETGLEIRVPFFIKEGEKIRVSTETGSSPGARKVFTQESSSRHRQPRRALLLHRHQLHSLGGDVLALTSSSFTSSHGAPESPKRSFTPIAP